jgi:esterase FrsA
MDILTTLDASALMLPSPNPPLLPLQGSPIYYQGPDLNQRPKPTVLFFALSAYMSLYVDPFNQAVLRLSQQGIRVFSWDLPFHSIDQDPNEAMRQWVDEFARNPAFVSDFIALCQENISYLIEEGYVDPQQLAVAGLSRGGFIATHLAAQDKRIQTVLGFAPLTQPQPLEERERSASDHFENYALSSWVDELVHTRLRFYMGNRDTRVSTDACYHFIRLLTEAAFAKGIRSPQVELILYPSIGYKGHGTPPEIFYDGADWVKRQLIAEE